MDGQQVYVTGADGEQMVLSGPEAAALLAQAGITLGDQDQVMIAGSDQHQAGEQLQLLDEDQMVQQEQMVAEEGSILAPEGSTVADDGSIIAADGTILAPPGTVMIGEDGSLMMAENSALLTQDEEKQEGKQAEGVLSGGGGVFTTADGSIITAGEGNVLTDADGNVLTDQDGNILTTADIGALTGHGEVINAEQLDIEGNQVPSGEADITTADGNVITSDGNFLRTADGNILTDADGNFLTSDGNILKPEEAQKILEQQAANELEQQAASELEQQAVSELEQQVASEESAQMILEQQTVGQESDQIVDHSAQIVDHSSQIVDPSAQIVDPSAKIIDHSSPIVDASSQIVDHSAQILGHSSRSIDQIVDSEPEKTPEDSIEKIIKQQEDNNVLDMVEESQISTFKEDNVMKSAKETALAETDQMKMDVEAAMEEIEPTLSNTIKNDVRDSPNNDTENITDMSEQNSVGTESIENFEDTTNNGETPSGTTDSEESLHQMPAVSTPLHVPELSSDTPAGDILDNTVVSAPAVTTSVDGGIYTTSDGRVVSMPEGIMTNAEGNLINPADGSILTTEDGTPLCLPEGVVLKPVQEENNMLSSSGQLVDGNSTGGIVVSATAGTIMTTTDGTAVMAGAEGSVLTSEDGTMITAPEGSVITSDGSILAADGTVLAPPGSVVTGDGGQLITQDHQQEQLVTHGQQQQFLSHEQQQFLPQEQQQFVTQEQQQFVTQQQQIVPQQQFVNTQQQQLVSHQTQQQVAPSQPHNLIGLQLPEESGEVLYLDPNDPAAQLLLQEAGITLGEGGVLQTADGQILQGEDGTPITTNVGQQQQQQQKTVARTNNLVGDAAAAAGLVTADDMAGFQLPTGVTPTLGRDTSSIDIPLTSSGHGSSQIRPNLPLPAGSTSYQSMDEHQRQLSQTRYTTPSTLTQQQSGQQIQGQGGQKYQKLTFNSSAAYSNPTPAPIQKKTVAPRQKKSNVPSTDMQIGPDQQKVTYTVTSENGYSQTYMMICSKSLDQNTLINTLIKNISNDPNHKGKKTIKITQHKYGAKKQQKQPQQQRSYGQQRQQLVPNQVVQQQPLQLQQQQQPLQQQQQRFQPQQQQRRITPQPQNVRQQPQQVLQQFKQASPVSPKKTMKPASPIKPPQQILQSEPDCILPPSSSDNFTDNLSLDDIVSQIGGGADEVPAAQSGDEPRVMVKCNYCTNFRSPLNSATWENILNHILPVAKEELHSSFYGNILKHFARSLRVSVSGRGSDQCEVVVSHGLVCRRTGAWYSVDRPGVELATTLASHIAAVQPGVSGPYGARPRGNSLICLFCCSPYTAEDYQRHLKPHQDFIIPCLLLAAGAYCATSFELDVRRSTACGSCRETETQDLRFLPCTKFASDFNCIKRLQSTVDCFRENFDSRGFLQVSNSAMTKCSVCRTPNNTYCALFKPNQATMLITGNPDETLSVCANCQKQFVNVVMRENSFEKQLKMFQLHHMEQLCGMLRVLLSASQAVCTGNYNLLYTVQEGGSLYSASNTLHSVLPAKLLVNPVHKTSKLEEDKSRDMSGPSLRYVCEQCKFSIDLTRLQHPTGRDGLAHLVDMAIGVVLEHIVPHTESLLAVIMTAAFNEVFRLKFEFTAHVEGEGNNKKINISLDRKVVPTESTGEVIIQKDVHKNSEVLKQRLRQDKKGNVCVKRKHIFMDNFVPVEQGQEQTGQLMEVGKFLEQATPVLQLYGSSGCNTKLLDYYAECRLCSKFSFPDFRLTAAIRHRDGVALCENCCETILSLCVPSEPEKIPGRGEVCLLLGIEKNTGHRLVLSNHSKKWISADGVERIQAVSEVAASSAIPDYGTTLVQLLRSHLQAVAERAWSDNSCLTARAGFCVTDPSQDSHQLDEMTGQPKQNPIEVKVTVRPPKPKTPPPKLMITPVQARGIVQKKAAISASLSSPSPTSVTSSSSKLVKITANRRIIPVRDPTSISTSPRIPPKNIPKSDADTKAKIAALRESLKANAQLNDSENNQIGSPKLPACTTISEASPPPKKREILKPGVIVPDDYSDLEGEDDFESIDAIADFINSSEPPQKAVNPSNSNLKKLSSFTTSGPSMDLCGDVVDEFTDSALTTPKPPRPFFPEDALLNTLEDSIKLSCDDLPPTATELKLPPGLNITRAPAGMVKIQAGGTGPPAKVIELGHPVEPSGRSSPLPANLIELGSSSKSELDPPLVPSPASDATTSTKDTVTPNSPLVSGGSKVKKPYMPRLLPRQGESSPGPGEKKADEKTSTVKPVNRPPSRKETELSPHEKEHLTSLLDLDMDSDEGEKTPINMKKTAVKLSSILPKPNRGRPPGPTNASSSKKGVVSKATPKVGDKRKRLEDATVAAADATRTAKKHKLYIGLDNSEDQKRTFICEKCKKGFFRDSHLTRHMKIHGDDFPCKSCGKSYDSEDKLVKHARLHFSGDNEEATTSEGKTFRGKLFSVDISKDDMDLARKEMTPQQTVVSIARKELAKSKQNRLRALSGTKTQVQPNKTQLKGQVNKPFKDNGEDTYIPVPDPIEITPMKGTKTSLRPVQSAKANLIPMKSSKRPLRPVHSDKAEIPPVKSSMTPRRTVQSAQSKITHMKGSKMPLRPVQSAKSEITPMKSKTPLRPVQSDKTPTSKDQTPRGPGTTDFVQGTSQSGRVRKAKIMFDL